MQMLGSGTTGLTSSCALSTRIGRETSNRGPGYNLPMIDRHRRPHRELRPVGMDRWKPPLSRTAGVDIYCLDRTTSIPLGSYRTLSDPYT